MPSEDTKILEFNQYWKSNKIRSIIYADLESLIKKVEGDKNNPEKSSTTKVGEHIPCRYSMFTIQAFVYIENNHGVQRRKDCMKVLWILKRAHNQVNFEEKENDTIDKRRV